MANDYYRTLGIRRGATPKDIQSAYRRLARKYHPDVTGGDKAAEARFKAINEAHEVLGDEKKRAAYEKWGDRWMHAEQLEEAQRRGGPMRGPGGPGGVRFEFGGQGGPFGGLGDIFGGGGDHGGFERLFRGGGPGGPRPSKGEELRQQVTVSLAEAFSGSTRTVRLPTIEPCTACGGGGRTGAAICHECLGQGRTRGDKRIEVTIPAGIETGAKIRLRGKGGPGRAGGPPGDVVLEVEVATDPRFERRGSALHTEVAVGLTTALLGGEVIVPTITGQLALQVPPATQNGRVFRLAGKGMPVMKRDRAGDLFAKVRVVLPEQIDDERRALFERLRELESDGGAGAAGRDAPAGAGDARTA